MNLRLPVLCLATMILFAPGGFVGASGAGSATAANQQATPIAQIKDWFNKYDAIRRGAQMNPQERAKADGMLAKGLAMFMPGQDKQDSAALFQTLEQKNGDADAKLKLLPLYPETEQLHRGYHQYFDDTSKLFADYLKVQNNLMTTDPTTGKPLMGQLLARKKALEDLDVTNKAMDADLRARFKIPAYKY